MNASEILIEVNENDYRLGPILKEDCHLMKNINDGKIHRAFSVLIFNSRNEMLITERSDFKLTFSSMVTNSCCGHPLYNEDEMEEHNMLGTKRAAIRRMVEELGVNKDLIQIDDFYFIRKILYKAKWNEKYGEHELAHVFVFKKDIDLKPNPEEVKNYKFINLNDLFNMRGNNRSFEL